jgi:ABC-type transport system substrate-binding protein
VFTILLFSSCKQKDNSNTLNVSLSGEISTIDPANSYDTISASIVYQGYEQLYEYHYLKRPYTLQPHLAEAMPLIENDGKKYTIKIKKGIQYHDDPSFKGEKRFVTAHDFITQIKRLAYLPTNSNGWWLFDGKIKGLNKFRKDAGRDFEKFKSLKIEGLTAVDDHTLVIELNDTYPQMLYTLAMSFTSPVPIEAVEMYENNLNDKIIGTGPYQLDKWESSIRLKLKKNPNYRKVFYPGQGDRIANSRKLLKDSGKVIPFIEKIEYNVYKEAQTRWLNFKAKKIDYLIIPKDNYSSAVDPNGNLTKELKEEKIKLQIFPTLTYWWLSFNMNDPILGKNLNLRKAIAHAIDIEKYINVFTNNIGQKSNSIYPPGIPGYDPSSKLPYEYSKEKAKMYLAKAGYPKGKGLPTLTYDVRGVSATNRQQADFVKSELLKIGINVQVALNNFPAFLEKSRNGKLQFWQDGWALDYPDAENVLQLLISRNHAPGPNATFYSNPKFDKLFEKLKVLPNGREKVELMRQMEEIILDELPWVMQYYSRNYILYHDRLNNYRHSDLIYNNFKYLRLK